MRSQTTLLVGCACACLIGAQAYAQITFNQLSPRSSPLATDTVPCQPLLGGLGTTQRCTWASGVVAGGALPHVSTKAALSAAPSTQFPVVVRDGYSTVGDAPPLTYVSSSSACSLNGGAGDGGSQVASLDGKCWIAQFPPGPLDTREWGVVANSTTDSTAALRAAWNYGGSVNTDILLPPSNYSNYVLFSSISAPGGSHANPGLSQNLSAIRGRGLSQSVLYSSVTGTNCAITFNGASGTYDDSNNARSYQGFTLLSVNTGSGYGICLNQITGMSLGDFSVRGFNYGLVAHDVIRLNLNNPHFYTNGTAIYGDSTGSSNPNQWTIISPTIGNSTMDAIYLVSPADIDIYGGDFEGNNSANNLSYATIHIHGNPNQGQKGLSVFGGYYQGNGGAAEIEIDQTSNSPGMHSIYGIEEAKLSNATYPFNILLLNNGGAAAAVTRLDVHGSAFWNAAGYTPSASHAYIAVANPSIHNYVITGYDSNDFYSSIEAPWTCPVGTNCINLPDGHIEEWGTATTGSSSPYNVAVTWPKTCPTAVDNIIVTSQNGTAPIASGYNASSQSVTGATMYSASGPAGLSWRVLCH